MSRSIRVLVKFNYGQKAVYPSCSNALAFARIAGTRTLTQDTLQEIASMGYEIITELPSALELPEAV